MLVRIVWFFCVCVFFFSLLRSIVSFVTLLSKAILNSSAHICVHVDVSVFLFSFQKKKLQCVHKGKNICCERKVLFQTREKLENNTFLPVSLFRCKSTNIIRQGSKKRKQQYPEMAKNMSRTFILCMALFSIGHKRLCAMCTCPHVWRAVFFSSALLYAFIFCSYFVWWFPLNLPDSSSSSSFFCSFSQRKKNNNSSNKASLTQFYSVWIDAASENAKKKE